MLGIVLKKQKLNNYDVIESYVEDFTRWRIDNTGVTTTQKKITIAAKSQIQSQLKNPNQNMQPAQPAQLQQVNIWDEIDKEVCSLNNDQQAILAKDDVYNNISAELQMLIQQELINSVRDKVANSPRGKELLEKQLNNIRAKKDGIIEEANKELELFKKFQIAAQANPKLTYVDFCNNIKNKEV